MLKGKAPTRVDWFYNVALVTSLCVLGVALIVMNPWQAWADQQMLLRCARFEDGYPAMNRGLTSCLFAALAPGQGVELNTNVRIIAMLFFVISSSILGFYHISSRLLRALFAVMLLVSHFPFVWLSSELVAAGFMCLALFAVTRTTEARTTGAIATGAILGGLAMAKPDMLLVAIALVCYAAYLAPTRRSKVTLVVSMLSVIGMMVLPGFFTEGGAYWSKGGERHWLSFGQHVALLFTGRPVWSEWQIYVSRIFPGANSVWDVITTYPLTYLQYLGLSANRGLISLIFVLSWLFVTLPVFAGLILARKLVLPPLMRPFALTWIGIVPMLCLSFPHIRYMTRYYTAAAVIFFMMIETIVEWPRSWYKWLSMSIIVLAFGWYLYIKGYGLLMVALHAPVNGFWGAD